MGNVVKFLHLDIETQSEIDLSETGVYRYVEGDEFGIQLLSYAYNDEPVRTLDLAHGDAFPESLAADILNPDVKKVAHNASFERVCFSRLLLGPQKYIDPKGWACTLVLASYFNLPESLAKLGEALGLPEDKAKLKEGPRLVKMFSGAGHPDMSVIPQDAAWEKYLEYNAQDVIAEREIWKRFTSPEMSCAMYPRLMTEYQQSERINDRGVLADLKFTERMIELTARYKEQATAELGRLCDAYAEKYGQAKVENTNSTSQLKKLLGLTSLRANDVDAIIEDPTTPEDTKQILRLRASLAQSAVTKYDKIVACACADGRIRGLFKFYGAGTGRFAGRLVQLQNLKKNHFDDVAAARDLYMNGSPEFSTDLLSDLGELIRTALIPKDGCTFSDADYSAIEARVLAYIAGEQWRVDAFCDGRDIYCESASRMFGKPVVKGGENGELRGTGKVAELACGYGGGVGAFKRMGGERLGLTEDETAQIISDWRSQSPHIVDLWYNLENWVKRAIRKPGTEVRCYAVGMGVTDISVVVRPMAGQTGYRLELTLPITHRRLIYPNIRIESGGIMYTSNRGVDKSLYGGKLTENLIQAVARDILTGALMLLEDAGYPVVMHIHDEVLVEYPTECVKEIAEIMAHAADPYVGLPLKAEGYQCDFFIKQ